MNHPDYLQPYQDAIREHGDDFKATLWARPETQRRRFEVFAEMVDFTHRRVLDAGCSRGDFAQFLLDQDQPYARFIGVDGLPEVIGFARARGLPRAEFHAGDLVRQAASLKHGEPELITLSGTLNTMSLEVALSVLEHAWAGCSQGLLFNFLSDRCGPAAPPQAYPAKRLPTLHLMDWALQKTASVVFRQDYLPHGHDATILMIKA